MEMISFNAKIVDSSFITGLSYNRNSRKLKVKIGSTSYVYADVPSYLAMEFKDIAESGESCGSFYSSNIRGQFISLKKDSKIKAPKVNKVKVVTATKTVSKFSGLSLVR